MWVNFEMIVLKGEECFMGWMGGGYMGSGVIINCLGSSDRNEGD